MKSQESGNNETCVLQLSPLPCKLWPGRLQGSPGTYQVWSLKDFTGIGKCKKKKRCGAFLVLSTNVKTHRIRSVRVSLEPLTWWISLILKELQTMLSNEPLAQTADPSLSRALFKQKWTMPFWQSRKCISIQVILAHWIIKQKNRLHY